MRFQPKMVNAHEALPGHDTPIVVSRNHLTLGVPLNPPYPSDAQVAYFALGCFWGAEKTFFQLPGVIVTAVGYQGGFSPNPTYQEVCTGRTGHTEAVKVVFHPDEISYETLLKIFYESHDPTQGNRQGGDIGTQYRSAIYYVDDEQARLAKIVTESYAEKLHDAGYGDITTEIAPAGPFYMAEEYHQQYLIANPNGYCGIGGTGVSCPVGVVGA